MAIPHAKSGEVIDIRPLGEALRHSITSTLVKTERLEVIRLIVLAGKDVPLHQVTGEITVQCLEGRIAFTAEAPPASWRRARCSISRVANRIHSAASRTPPSWLLSSSTTRTRNEILARTASTLRRERCWGDPLVDPRTNKSQNTAAREVSKCKRFNVNQW